MLRFGKQRAKKGRSGGALILCILMTSMLLAAVTMLSTRAAMHVRHSQYRAWRAGALSGAESALVLARSAVQRGDGHAMGFAGDIDAILSGRVSPPSLTDRAVTPQGIAGAPELTWYAVAGTPTGYGADIRVVVAVARVHTVEAAVEAIYRVSPDGGAWTLLTWRERPIAPVEAS